MRESLLACIPVVVGAMIAIVPTLIEKFIDKKYQKEEKQHLEKQKLYVDLITLFGIVLKKPCEEKLSEVREIINLISITGSVDVVQALNEYIDTWGIIDEDEQNKKYNELLKVIRVDLGIDKKICDNFPDIGLRDINCK